MQCPNCNSNTARKFEILYDDGTAESVSYNSERDKITSTSTTKLAQRCAPPNEPYPTIIFNLFAIISTFMLYGTLMDSEFLGSFLSEPIMKYLDSLRNTEGLIAGIGIFLVIFSIHYLLRYLFWSKYLWKKYRINYSQWKNKWLCLKCGHDYIPK